MINAVKNDKQPYVTAMDGKRAAEGRSVKLPKRKYATTNFKGRLRKCSYLIK